MEQDIKASNELQTMFVDLFSTKIKEQVNKTTNKNYSFKVATFLDINFQKIMDDLSYADPLRIVKVGDELFTVVHHTIFDKYMHSLSPKVNLLKFIAGEEAFIKANEIKHLITDIQLIKQSQWVPSTYKPFQVEVIKVKV